MKFHNFLRFGEKNNTIVFDLTNEQKKGLVNNETSMDAIYEEVAKDPIGHIEGAKKRGIEQQIGIIGLVAGDPDSSNGVGKSSIMDGICYAHYEKIVRKTANNDKIEKAGLSVVTKLDKEYPKDLRDSYVEEFLEDNGSIYRIKRGRTFSKNQKSSTPILEFECIKDGGIDKRGSHRKADTADSIADVITMDYDVFVNSQMFGQSDAGKYLTGTDKTKKEMLISLLRLENVVTGCLDSLRKRKNDQDKKVGGIKSKIDFIEDMFCKAYTKYAEQEAESFEEKMPQKIIDVLGESRKKNLDKIKKCDNKRDEIQGKIDELFKNEKLTLGEKIKEEAARVKQEKIKKEEDKSQQISDWDKLNKSANEEIKSVEKDIQVKELKLKSIREEIKSVEKKIESFSQDDCDKKLEKTAKAKIAKPIDESALLAQRGKREELVKSIAGEKSKEKELLDENKDLQDQIEHIKDGEDFTCKKCKSKVSKEHIIEEIANNKNKIELISKNISTLNKNKESVENEINRLTARLNKIESYIVAESKIKGEIETNLAIKANLQNINNSESDLVKEIEDFKGRLIISNKKAQEYREKIVKISAAFDVEIEAINSRIEKLREDFIAAKKEADVVTGELNIHKENLNKIFMIKNETSEKLGFLDREIGHYTQLIDELGQRHEEFKQGAKQLNRYLILESVYGLDGIQTRIVNRYLPLLNIYIKEFLDILSRGTIDVKMEVNSRSKIDMLISGSSADSYEMLSGGEKMIVRLAVDIGMALLAFSRSSQKPEIICLDEIFGPLDKNNTESVFEMLNKLQDKFNRVLIITHNPEIQSRLTSNIVIEKDAGSLGLSEIKRIE